MDDETSLLQPYEGIYGAFRDNFLLSLEDEATEHREALMRMAKHLRAALLTGHPAPIATRIWEQVSKPEPGDLVVETTRALHSLDHQGFGILLAHRTEWAESDKARAQYDYPGEERPREDVWYVQYGNGHRDIARWQDCEFMTLPVAVESFGRLPVVA